MAQVNYPGELNKGTVDKYVREGLREPIKSIGVIWEKESLGVLTTSRIKGLREESHSTRSEERASVRMPPVPAAACESGYLQESQHPAGAVVSRRWPQAACDDPEGKNRTTTCPHYPPVCPPSGRASLWLGLVEIRGQEGLWVQALKVIILGRGSTWNWREGKRGSEGASRKPEMESFNDDQYM